VPSSGFGTFNHGLRSSASPVLTATGLVIVKGQISSHQRIDTPQPITKNLLQMITSVTVTDMPNLVQIRPRGLLCKWVKYNKHFVYLFIYRAYLVIENSPTGQTTLTLTLILLCLHRNISLVNTPLYQTLTAA